MKFNDLASTVTQSCAISEPGAGHPRPADPHPPEMSPPLPDEKAAQNSETSEGLSPKKSIKNSRPIEKINTSKRPKRASAGVVKTKCVGCGKYFTHRASHKERRKYCSRTCQHQDTHANRAARRNAEAEDAVAKALVSVTASSGPLSPEDSSILRGRIAAYIEAQLAVANNVVLGFKEWSPTQARVFGMLLNKVIPDLNASFIEKHTTHTDLAQLSRAELEHLAVNTKTITERPRRLAVNDDSEDDTYTEVVDFVRDTVASHQGHPPDDSD